MATTEAKPIRVLVVDDHKSFTWGITKLIDGEKPRMCVAGVASDRAEALALARRERPDLVLLDISLGSDNTLDLIPELLSEVKAHVLVLTGDTDPETHEIAIQRGASGVVLKTEEAEVILRAIVKVHEGELWLDRAATGRVFAKLSRAGGKEVDSEASKIEKLTPREREIVLAITKEPSATVEKIAQQLNVSPKTLTNHLTTIYSILGIEPPNSRFKLFMYAKAHGLDRASS